jgi:DNA replication and repair protein RecF
MKDTGRAVNISQLFLKNFRNFSSKRIHFSSEKILLYGNNGTGKTNILEALTLLGKNSSLRGDDFSNMVRSTDSRNFSVFSEISNHEFIEKIGVSFDKNQKKKILKINDETLNSKALSELKNYFINFVFLTPRLESLFILGKSERRDYLDKIVCDLDYQHIERVSSYQKSLKERLLILQKYSKSTLGNKWIEIVEEKIAELAVAIGLARFEAIEFFNKAIQSFSSNFPKTKLTISCDLEISALNNNSQEIEKLYKQRLFENRSADLARFKTSFGVHRSDFFAVFIDKNMKSSQSSTGEQKAMMLSITLARAKISAFYKNQPTILIFDEVASHLDKARRYNLFDEIEKTKLQCFFSATSHELFDGICNLQCVGV